MSLYLLMASVVAVIVVLLITIVVPMCFRRVVSTNDVHIVQSRKNTVSYGKGQTTGNVYYAWPSWIPIFGINVIKLPVSIVTVELKSYNAYDKGRVPFIIDIMAFFRVDDPNTTAQRVHSFEDMLEQLQGILQGACRSILAKAEIETILEDRGVFSKEFTEAVGEQLREWGVVNVKSIELMDIRDANESKVIHNIMAKKQSFIEKESRVEIASNGRIAQEAEIAARQEIAVKQQVADRAVGIQTADKERDIGIAREKAAQEIAREATETKSRNMEIIRVETTKQAEITKAQEIVNAEQDRATMVIRAQGKAESEIAEAEGQKRNTILIAEGDLEKALKNAEGLKAEGDAKASAAKALALSQVDPQITLAKEIGENQGYQSYLIGIESVRASVEIGIAQAGALTGADVKIIANTGDPVSGLTSVRELFSSKGGTALGALLEGLSQTPQGKAIVERLVSIPTGE